MIKNLWKNTTFYCMNHEKYEVMEIRQGPKEIFYACPKYYPDNRSEGEKPCMNNMYIQIAQQAVEHFAGIIEEYEKQGIDVNIKGEKWVNKNVEFKVLEHKRDSLKIGILNRKFLNMQKGGV